jgi:3-hydroxyacyl-[acyl-carrier-protein] dehydratase
MMIDPRTLRPLRLGAEAVRRLLPHRPPLLLVDGVTAFSPEPPALRAMKHISGAEPVFAGHFPDHSIWPGAYTIEGLAQACALCGALHEVDVAALERSPDDATLAEFPSSGARRGSASLLAAVNVKLTRPVLAGQRLDYWVVHTHAVDGLHRFEVEASVDSHTVASGTLTVALRGDR